jgi:hypothetical protein
MDATKTMWRTPLFTKFLRVHPIFFVNTLVVAMDYHIIHISHASSPMLQMGAILYVYVGVFQLPLLSFEWVTTT